MSDARRIRIDGVEYRVLDCVMRRGKFIFANPPATWADTRVFRPREGHKRLYRFTSPADRAIDDATLIRQLRGAAFLPAEPAYVPVTDPR